jgi:uncharacterized membrane protein YdfJ with MMPL/SSD domain
MTADWCLDYWLRKLLMLLVLMLLVLMLLVLMLLVLMLLVQVYAGRGFGGTRVRRLRDV